MSVSYLVVQCQTQIKNVCHLDPDPCVKMFQFFFYLAEDTHHLDFFPQSAVFIM